MLYIEPKKYGHIGFIGNKALVRLRFAKDYFESDVVYLLKNHMLATTNISINPTVTSKINSIMF